MSEHRTGEMVQQHMHESFRPCLLGLPPAIRRHIYLHLGVARWDGFHTVFDLDCPFGRTKQVGFHGLLLSCRTIYDEASALLFSANRFVMHYRQDTNEADGSLQPLRNLTARSLASMTQLKIVLNQASCHHRKEFESNGDCCNGISDPYTEFRHGTPSEGWCPTLHATRHDSPLRRSHSSAAPILDEWLKTARYLASRIGPRTFELSLVCDMGQHEADLATQVVAPLLLLPELKDCHVRLCRDPSDKLAAIAQNAALQACHRTPPTPRSPSTSSTSHLVMLPRELRLQILEYTDLVTPWKEVMWSRLQRGYQFPVGGCPAGSGSACPPDEHKMCRFWGCQFQPRIGESGFVVYYDSIGCFCRLGHAAFSSTCRCWAPPTPLFLVCRALLEDARLVFFSQNRFVVNDSLASASNPCVAFDVFKTLNLPVHRHSLELPQYRQAQPPRAYPAERFAASEFLREVVPASSLRHLRFLELVFPPYNQDCWPQDGHPALQNWDETIDWVRDKINIPNITLRVTMAGMTSLPPSHPDMRDQLTQTQGDRVLAGYDRILAPLARLGGGDGLACFHADFAWPWKWTEWVKDRYKNMDRSPEPFGEWMRSKEDAWNERAERFVLGDRYEPLESCSGKRERELRQWQKDCLPWF